DDAEGRIIATSEKRPSREEIARAIPSLVGRIVQTPPAFSAVKIDGERAYDLAREGQAVAPSPREVAVYDAQLLNAPDPDTAEFEMRCSKGAYVRAWVRDLARELGTVGHVCALRRTEVGPFTEGAAIGLEK